MPQVAMLEILKYRSEFRGEPSEALEEIAECILRVTEEVGWESYVQSGPPRSVAASYLDPCSTQLLSDSRQLGAYEGKLLRRLTGTRRTPFFLIGPPGSGKSTTLRVLLDQFVNTSELTSCHHPTCHGRRCIVKVNFNDERFHSAKTAEAARAIVLAELNSALATGFLGNSSGRDGGPLANDLDLTSFWDWAEREIKNGSASKIRGLRRIDEVALECGAARAEAKERRKCRSRIFEDASDKLDYLLAMAHFLTCEHFSPSRPCFIVVLDNVDYASMAVQVELVRLLSTRTQGLSMRMVIVLREETFRKRFGAHIPFEIMHHAGPRSVSVLERRLAEFQQRYPSASALSAAFPGLEGKGDAEAVYRHIQGIGAALEVRTAGHSVLRGFIVGAMSEFVRGLLVGAQYLIYNRREFVTARLTEHHLLRAFVRHGLDHFPSTGNVPICNLFACRVGFENIVWIKIRVLQYLRRVPAPRDEKFENLGRLVAHLRGFGYSEEAVGEALRDLASEYHQLIIVTDGSDTPSTLEEPARVYITSAGEQYVRAVVQSLDYIGETMVACAVGSGRNGRYVDGSYVSERMHAVVHFLGDMLRTEKEEILRRQCSVGLTSPEDRGLVKDSEYVHAYGELPMGYHLLVSAWGQLRRVASAVCDTNQLMRPEFDSVLQDGASAVIEAGNCAEEYERAHELVRSRREALRWRRVYADVMNGPKFWGNNAWSGGR